MVETVVGQAGGIDVLVNNAGVFDMAPLLEITRESYRETFAVNVEGLPFTLQVVARQMVKQGRGGKIVNFASQAGRRGEALVAVYCASKAAVISITQSAGPRPARERVNVNGIAPGVVDTPMWDEVDALFAKYEKLPLGEKKKQVGLAVPWPHGQAGGHDRHGGVPGQQRRRLHRGADLQCGWRQLDERNGRHERGNRLPRSVSEAGALLSRAEYVLLRRSKTDGRLCPVNATLEIR